MELYNLLPDFTGPDMLPPERMAHYRDNIRPNMQYCGLIFVPRLTPWCKYIKEYDAKMKSMNMSVSNKISNKNASDMPQSIIETINDAGCYDTYNCDVPELAGAIHSLMMAVMIIVLIGLISNLYCLVKMYMQHNRAFIHNSFGINLAALIIADCLHLVLALLLFVMPALVSYRYQAQLKFYQRVVVIIVPWLLPIWDLTNLIATWIIISLLIHRSNITRVKMLAEAGGDEFMSQPNMNFNSSHNRKRAIYLLIGLILGLIISVVPKFAEYTFNYDVHTDKGIIVPLLRVIKLYRLIMLKLFYPSIECTVPVLLMLAYIVAIKYHEIILMRSRIEKDLSYCHHHHHKPVSADDEELESKISIHCEQALLSDINCSNNNNNNITTITTSSKSSRPSVTVVTLSNNINNDNSTSNDLNNVHTLTNMKVFSVSGVSKKTQLVIWTSIIMVFHLVMKLSAMIVTVERTLEGSPKEQWPRLRQIIKTTSIVFAIVACAIKPLIYIHCCPRLLRRDLSKGLFDKNSCSNFNQDLLNERSSQTKSNNNNNDNQLSSN